VIRLLICDSSSTARLELRTTLEEQQEIEVVGEAADAEQAVALAAALSPDVVLLDAELPVADGEGATARIKRLLPGARIVALAGSADRQAVDSMIAAGADAYCVKGAPLWELERALARAIRCSGSPTRSRGRRQAAWERSSRASCTI
jgi:DNA-binding NarL/FixJ family response regulator